MKTLFKIIILTILGSLLSCSKSKDSNPDYGQTVSGYYTVTSYSKNGSTISLPSNGFSAILEIQRLDNSTVKGTLTSNDNGTPTIENIPTYVLKDEGSSVIGFYLTGNKEGFYGLKEVTLMLRDKNGIPFTITAKK